MTTPEPRSLHLVANGLRHHLLDWGGSGPVVLLLHGFLEHAHVWDFAAPRIAAGGHRVYALDWRGHGDSERVGRGGYYHFADYIADLAFLVPQLADRVALVAHSMGGGAAICFAGTAPERLWALVSVEGVGLPDSDPASAPERFAAWIQDLKRIGERRPRRLTLDEAAQRLRRRNPTFSDEVVTHMARWGTREERGERAWKFDPLHQTQAPQPYYLAQARAFWARVACPVLYLEGSRTPLRLPADDLDERLRLLRAQRLSIDDTGHHPHLERPEEFARAVNPFLRRARSPDV